MKCRDYEPSTSGRVLINKKTEDRIHSVYELADKFGCRECGERYRCKLIEILECNIC